jgi:hypothetical protein
MSGLCPCCGQARPEALDAAVLDLSPRMAAIVRTVARKPGISAQDLASVIYADDPDGGPLTAEKTVATIICNNRGVLARHGLRLFAGRGSRSGYRLVAA